MSEKLPSARGNFSRLDLAFLILFVLYTAVSATLLALGLVVALGPPCRRQKS